ncbi:MAG: DUF6448 family protein [Planctomycetota bacterium]
MSVRTRKLKTGIVAVTLVIALVFGARTAWNHCDTMNGPVSTMARKALETGQFETISIFVGDKQEKELRQRFEQCLAAYKMGGHAKELAERYFLETAVRLNRKTQGIPFKGLKPAQPFSRDILAAEKSLETGDLKPVTDLLYAKLQQETEKWFQKAMEARNKKEVVSAEELQEDTDKWFAKAMQGRTLKDESVAAGRQRLNAYFRYIIYVRGLYLAIQAGPKHGVPK